jgi:hypothetical protein
VSSAGILTSKVLEICERPPHVINPIQLETVTIFFVLSKLSLISESKLPFRIVPGSSPLPVGNDFVAYKDLALVSINLYC